MKTCVPLVSENPTKLIADTRQIAALKPDLVEWRADYLMDQSTDITETANHIKSALGTIPLLFTFRKSAEGGKSNSPNEERQQIILKMLREAPIDYLDTELSEDDGFLENVIREGKKRKVSIILSVHNFSGTPLEEAMKESVQRAKKHDADFAKLAVTPVDPVDLIRLFSLSEWANREVLPTISVAMGSLGNISRVMDVFQNPITYAAVGESSAPGQLSLEEVRIIQKILRKDRPGF